MAQLNFNCPEFETSDKWEAQMRKGCLEMAVLASLWHGRSMDWRFCEFWSVTLAWCSRKERSIPS